MTKVHADYSDIKQSEAVANGIKSNNLTDFKKYLDNPNSDIRQYLGENGSADQYREAADAIADDKEASALDWSYDELVGRTLTLVTASDRYVDNGNGTFSYRETSDSNMSALKDSGLELKVSGVVRPAKDAQNATISTAVGYTQQLTDRMIDHTDSSAVVQAQEASADTDVLTGAVFADETGENGSSVKNTYDDNLEAFGKVSRDAPSSISIYTDSFDDKEAVADCIKAYNKGKDEDHAITYTDYVALMTSSISSIVNIITYVLIAFVALSLVVLCVMIGIITHISVMERTKEIGILRALGTSKHNVSQVFNAETIIIGLCSGLLGVGLTALLTIPANAMVANLLGSGSTLTISLPIGYARYSWP